jgi:hypothetical protein
MAVLKKNNNNSSVLLIVVKILTGKYLGIAKTTEKKERKQQEIAHSNVYTNDINKDSNQP